MRGECEFSQFTKRENALFPYFQKTGKSLNEHFQEVSDDESSNPGLRRVDPESVAETLKAIKSGM